MMPPLSPWGRREMDVLVALRHALDRAIADSNGRDAHPGKVERRGRNLKGV